MRQAKVRVIVLRAAGTNCDGETAFAFRSCGAQVESVHINQLFQGKAHLRDYHILAIPGGFTYGDDIESGRLLANELRLRLGDHLQRFITDGKLIIGICNGFQVLVKAGLLPGPLTEEESQKDSLGQTATLVSNDSGKFEARWVHLKAGGKSIWTEGLEDILYYPVAHAEGKFVPGNETVLERLKQNGQVAFRYCTRDGERGAYPENPNGSAEDIAGITDITGRILGLMPHPERHFLFRQHPFWTRLPGGGRHGQPFDYPRLTPCPETRGRGKKRGRMSQGARIFNNGVNYVEKNLL